MRFSRIEKRDLFFAGILISLAFAILLVGGYRGLAAFNSALPIAFGISFFTAGIGFLLHEIMHKYVAQRYALHAEFKAFYPMLWLALLFSFFGFIIAAPGAVFISGYMNRERNGKVSLAGPLTNVVLSILFLIPLLILYFQGIGEGLVRGILMYGLLINSILAAFNMIPVMPFDGAKILAWNKGIYFITLLVSIGLYISSWFI